MLGTSWKGLTFDSFWPSSSCPFWVLKILLRFENFPLNKVVSQNLLLCPYNSKGALLKPYSMCATFFILSDCMFFLTEKTEKWAVVRIYLQTGKLKTSKRKEYSTSLLLNNVTTYSYLHISWLLQHNLQGLIQPYLLGLHLLVVGYRQVQNNPYNAGNFLLNS